jgi:hypothetical protein
MNIFHIHWNNNKALLIIEKLQVQIDKKNTVPDLRILNHKFFQYTTILPNSD